MTTLAMQTPVPDGGGPIGSTAPSPLPPTPPPAPARSPAAGAVQHLLDRIQTDADLAWLLIGTETHRLLLQAEADETGEDLETTTLRRLSRRRPAAIQGNAQILWLRGRVRQLELWIGSATGRPPPEASPCPPGRWPTAWRPDRRPLLLYGSSTPTPSPGSSTSG